MKTTKTLIVMALIFSGFAQGRAQQSDAIMTKT